jgi:glycosyltransferase involved in cell wall biosynthesis
MSKPFAVVSCPIDTASGYGARARDFVKALYELKKEDWEIKILSQRWGNTSWGFIEDNKNEWGFLNELLLPNNQLTRQPDYWFQITVPNEFQPVGKLMSVGVTAGIETTVCDHSWIEGINRMNLTLASSNHAKKVFEESSFDQKNEQGQTVRQIRLEKPVETLFEGVDLAKYFHKPDEDIEASELVEALDSIEEDFNYLFVGHWLPGVIGEDRKNLGLTIKTFLETFKGKKSKPGLILKTTLVGNSIMDREEILKKIDQIRESVGGKDLPNIYLLHGDLKDEDMNDLYNHGKVKAMVCLSKGEGWGRPMLEFTTSKKPVIASAWSGHMDFLSAEHSCLVGGQITQIHPSAVVQNMLLPESGWFSYDEKQAQFYLTKVFENYSKYQENAKRQARVTTTEFSFDNMKQLLAEKVDKFPKPMALKLPTLKRIELPKLNPVK